MAPAPRTYSPVRLRLVLIALTLITLPFVVASSVLVYYYVKYSVLVDRRLAGERSTTPALVYSRPVVLRPGYEMGPQDVVRLLNGLRYEQRPSGMPGPAQFVAADSAVLLTPRSMAGEATEAIAAVFEKERLKELRGLRSRSALKSATLEGQLITQLSASREKRRRVRYEELPRTLVEAVLAIEDRRFFSHPGLDPFRIVAAAIRNLRAESYIPHGGSTITQQLVKNFFLTPQRTLKRKVQEALIAFILERRATKQEIFELYLNEVYLGQSGSFSINGVGEAAQAYFRKDVGNLNLVESALLAGMIQSPNPYNPFRHPERAKERRAVVLHAMEDAGFIDKAAVRRSLEAPIVVEPGTLDAAEAPYFVDLVREELSQRYDLASAHANLTVRTSLDVRLQALAQEALTKGLRRIDAGFKQKRPQPVQGALVALEPRTGAILALVGGRAYGQSQYDRATQARRQTGSTFKPFVYLAAFESVFDEPDSPPLTPSTVVDDTPAVFFYGDKEYMPENYEDNYLGPVTLRTALAKSLNVATVKVAEIVGYHAVARTWNKKIAVGAPVRPYPAAALGAFEATPMEMAAAFNVLANGGVRVPPVAVLEVGSDGNHPIPPKHANKPARAVRAESTFLVVNMMRSVLTFGTAGGARRMGFSYDGAGKTGTTNDLRDAWFAGFVPNLLCVVWVGYDDNAPINLSGAKAALPIWVDFMRRALAGSDPGVWKTPPQVVFLDIDRDSGLLAGPGCDRIISEAFIAGTEPHEVCQGHAF